MYATVYSCTQLVRYLDPLRSMARNFNTIPDAIIPWDSTCRSSQRVPQTLMMIAASGLLLLARNKVLYPPTKVEHYVVFVGSSGTTNAIWLGLLSNGIVINPASPPNNLIGTTHCSTAYDLPMNGVVTSDDLAEPRIATIPSKFVTRDSQVGSKAMSKKGNFQKVLPIQYVQISAKPKLRPCGAAVPVGVSGPVNAMTTGTTFCEAWEQVHYAQHMMGGTAQMISPAGVDCETPKDVDP
ncbi:hypothetical protein BJV74DRAFT_989808 [Russula compacta]|nr:hypothetical protein BJV74DRAFT_989808 [Russula compacta]